MLQYSFRRDAPPTLRTRTGLDQGWVDYDPIVDRPPLRWPNDARLALWICPNVLDYEFVPPHDPWLDPWPRTAPPDVMAFGRQEYGNRVGFWRLLDVLDRYDVRPTAVVNVTVLERYPRIADVIAERGWDILGHGMSNTRFIYHLDEAAERAYYRDMLDRVEALTGVSMKGMGGPGPQAVTENTCDLLAEAGVLYHGDWFLDDQPVPINVRSGRLVAMPYALETNDVGALATGEGDYFHELVVRQFDRLYDEGAESGRVLCISLHPHLMGVPQRIGYLERILDYVTSRSGVWHATGAEIAEYYIANYYDAAAARLAAARPAGG